MAIRQLAEVELDAIKTGTYFAFYNVLKIPMAFS
jgi:hypothetical protein